jgi:hypothetical protein
MGGSEILSEEEKQEMLHDVMNGQRGRAFLAARRKSHEGGLDEYIDFLSENTEFLETVPSSRITENFKL